MEQKNYVLINRYPITSLTVFSISDLPEEFVSRIAGFCHSYNVGETMGHFELWNSSENDWRQIIEFMEELEEAGYTTR